MDPFTLLVHDSDDAVSGRIVEILTDWSAAGWLDGFALVSVAEVIHHGEALAQNRVVVPARPGRPPEVRTLARLVEGRPVRVIVLNPVGWDPSWLEARRRRHRAGKLLYDRLARRISAIDVIITWHNGWWDSQVSAWPGWDTLIAAPQEAVSPSDGGFDLYCDPEDAGQVLAVAGHGAAFAATVGALWVGVESSPWDDSEGVDDLRMARAFHVRLEGGQVLERLREGALSSEALRAPGAVAARGPEAFRERVSALRAKLMLEPLPPRPAKVGKQAVGAWEALTLLVSFLWRSLVMAPSELSKSMMYRGKARAASMLTSAVFGTDSSKHVTVGHVQGRDASDPTHWVDGTEHDLQEILTKLSDHNFAMAPTSPPSGQESFWREAIDTSVALASGQRQRGVDPIIDEGVARWFSIEQIAPSQVQTWRGTGLNLGGVTDVPVNDLLLCDRALTEMRALSAADPMNRDETERNLRALERLAQTWQQSFFGHVGAMLVADINTHRQRIRDRIAELKALQQPDSAEAEDLAGVLIRFARTISLVAVGLLAVVGVLDWTGVVAWPKWAWIPLIVLFWLSALVTKYLTVQHRVFQILHRARESESLVKVIEREVPILVENLQRLRRVYGQYLSWSRLVPVFLAEPFGRATSSTSAVTRMTGVVPPSVVSGRYEPKASAQAQAQIQSFIWTIRTPAGQAWADFVDESYSLLSRRTEFAAQVPEDAFSLEDSRLRLWVEAVGESTSDGPRMSPALAASLMNRHTDALVTHAGQGRLGELVQSAFQLVTAEGKVLDSSLLGMDTPADFSLAAFSLDGLARDLSRPDDRMLRADGSGASQTDLLDEVRSVLIATRDLQMSDLALRRRDRLEGGAGADQDVEVTKRAPDQPLTPGSDPKDQPLTPGSDAGNKPPEAGRAAVRF